MKTSKVILIYVGMVFGTTLFLLMAMVVIIGSGLFAFSKIAEVQLDNAIEQVRKDQETLKAIPNPEPAVPGVGQDPSPMLKGGTYK